MLNKILTVVLVIVLTPNIYAQTNADILRAEREKTKVFINKIRSNFFDSLDRDDKRAIRKTKIRHRKTPRINAWVVSRSNGNYIYISDLLPVYLSWISGALVDSTNNQDCLIGYSKYIYSGYVKLLKEKGSVDDFIDYAYPFYRLKHAECGGNRKRTELEMLSYSNYTGGALNFFLLHEYGHILLGHQIAYEHTDCEERLGYEIEADAWALNNIIEKDVDPLMTLVSFFLVSMIESIYEEHSEKKLGHLNSLSRFTYLEKKIKTYWKNNPDNFGSEKNMLEMLSRLQFMKSELNEIYGEADNEC